MTTREPGGITHSPISKGFITRRAVALITGQTLNSATNDLHTARMILRELPGIYSALERGQISWLMARAVADATATLPAWARVQVDQAMVTGRVTSSEATAWR